MWHAQFVDTIRFHFTRSVQKHCMIRFGLLPLISGVLQLCVPSYSLRLLRRFGAERVGWFIVAAFAALAVAHFLDPLKPLTAGPTPGLTFDPTYAVASVLLLIGMGHIESVFSERFQTSQQERKLQADWQAQLDEKAASCDQLMQEIEQLTKEKEIAREFEAQYRFLFVENPQPMWLFDLRSARFIVLNTAAQRLYGFTGQEWAGMSIHELVPPELAAAFRQDLARPCSGAQFRGRWQHVRRDRTVLDVEVTAMDMKYCGSPARLILVDDVSLQARREAEEARAQKMQIVAQLADRFAHHFNTVLTVIDGHVNLLLHKQLGPGTTDQLKQISFAVSKATGMTRQLVAAGGRQPVQTELLGLNGVLSNLSPMLNRLVGDPIALKESYATHLPAIIADPGVLEHIIINLLLNARNAMPSGGTLTLKTAVTCREDPHVAGRSAEFVCLSISDTGCGIPDEMQKHLFEPFCHTTESGKGTGLGLASVYGAVKQHSGWIEITTDVGVGTEFRLYFPVPSPAMVSATVKQPVAAPSAGRETILLVEGEERARGLAACVLTRYGYKVIEADSAPTALLLFEGQANKISMLLVDLHLPDGIPGLALAKRLRKVRPDLRVLYTSDCEPTPEGQESTLVEGLEFVPKPFSPAKLIKAVQNCLGKDRVAAQGAPEMVLR